MTRTAARATPAVAALVYARRGWPVFPCHSPSGRSVGCSCGHGDCSSPGKHPRVASGLHAATTESSQIERWWTRWPHANVAIRTGAASQLVVIDVDPAHGGADSLDALVRRHGRFFEATRTVRTGGGGWHYYFEHPGVTVRNDTGRRLGRGIDVRAEGGYVLAPPSVHVSGERYELEPGTKTAAPLPEWLTDQLTREPERPAYPNPPDGVVGARWGEAALAGELDRLRTAGEGARNDTLNRIAFRLGQIVAAGALDETTVESMLVHGAQSIGLGEREATRTVRSGLTAGERYPRGPRPDGCEVDIEP